jgi:predicted permease
MLADLRFALRALGRAPGFVLAAVLCLGLGLGANTTVYSLVNSLIVRPLPYGESERLLAVVHEHAAQGVVRGDITLAAVLDVAERSRTLDGLAATDTRLVNLTGVDRPEALAAASVSGSYFDLLRVRPLLGRVLRAEESLPGAAPVVVLGEQLWRERFAADPSAVGRAIALDGKPYTIVGVVPDAAGMSGDRERLFIPLVHERDPAQRGWHSYDAIARLKPGVTLEAARAELRSIGARLATEFPESDRGWTIDALSLRESLVPGEVATVFAVMLGAVGFVLLIAAANVANLLLARTAGRARELAVRAALGAGRARVLRLVLLESVIVALGGGLLGVAVAFVGVRALRDSIPVNYPAWLSFEVDWRVLAYAFALSVGTGLLFGLVPALRATRRALAPTLREQGTREQWRRRRAPAARRAGRHRAGALAGAAGGRRSDDQEHAAPAGDRSRLPRGRRAGGARAHGWGALRRDHRAVGAARERGRPPGRAPRRGRRLRHLGGAAQRLQQRLDVRGGGARGAGGRGSVGGDARGAAGLLPRARAPAAGGTRLHRRGGGRHGDARRHRQRDDGPALVALAPTRSAGASRSRAAAPTPRG